MFPIEVLMPYLAACLLVVIAPGPDNILAIGRGLSQGRGAAILSATGAGIGILFHTLAAALGLSVLIQASETVFWVVKAIGAVYLVWLGYKALTTKNLIAFAPAAHLPLHRIFISGALSNILNPKPGLFVLAFLPQFVDAGRGSVTTQMLVYGALFATMTTVVFSLLGGFAHRLATWLKARPKVTAGLNIGAGVTFIVSGVSVLALKSRAN
ncbi:LysE family translocator [Rhodoferax saidenbachensis]|uniref:Threonine/homoserine/homoserine lactone efflux protein n=1 Tax=Rhodoferax saidenbachensis TaxID=1484693 RepID=A0ABU1ZTC6_9BURK|nr:LysE family translocator [Rhodoferax saidenbachensis]MDR7307786.1 threonine/homoserine/homoserine lactone efflux protein [Rhodoferax saidenbachensis]